MMIQWLLGRPQGWASPVLTGAMIVLILLGFAKLQTQAQGLKHTQAQLAVAQASLASRQDVTCALRAAGRVSENKQVRLPLKGALAYLANAVIAGEKAQPDPVKRAAADRFARRYLAFAAAIKPLPIPPCAPAGSSDRTIVRGR